MKITSTKKALLLPITAAAAIAVAVGGGSASATPGPTTIASPMFSSAYGSGCTYQVSAQITGAAADAILWEREGGAGAWTKVETKPAVPAGSVSFNWTPKSAGAWQVWITHSGGGQPAAATVKQGLNLVSLCLVM